MRPIPTSAKLRLNECLGGVECDSQPSSWVSLLLIHPPSAKDLQARTHHLLGTEYREETDDGSLNSRESFTEKGEEYLKEKTKKKVQRSQMYYARKGIQQSFTVRWETQLTRLSSLEHSCLAEYLWLCDLGDGK